MLNTIKGKLAASFAFLVIIISGLIIVHTWYSFKKDNLEHLRALLRAITSQTDIINKSERDFFSDETINPLFYETGNSPYVNNSKNAIHKVIETLQILPQHEELTLISSKEKIQKINILFERYERQFSTLIKLTQQRGFKDYGTVGTMRNYAHKLESLLLETEHSTVLMLRRHEKDFIIRKDQRYAKKLTNVAKELKVHICASQQLSSENCRQLLSLIDDYEQSFQKMAFLEYEIGKDRNSGKRGELNRTLWELNEEINHLNEEILKSSVDINNNVENISLVVMLVALFLGITSAIYTVKALSKPIQQLSSSIHDVVKSNFKGDKYVEVIKTKDEIGRLSKDFLFMFDKVRSFITEIEQKSDKIASKQEQILNSLRYAQKVQEAVMPTEEKLFNYLGEHFILYKPKDYVSGDFYWITQKNGYTFLAVVDCTGHGVPGAFMSMIGTILLYKIVVQQKNYNPSIILETLNQEIKDTLHQEEGKGEKNSDGMDLSFIRIEEISDSHREIKFAGAKGDIIYIHKNKIHRIKGSRCSIGGKRKRPTIYESHTIVLEREDSVYLMSDGFADQNNKERKKFGSNSILKFLEEIKDEDMPEQKDLILEILQRHQGLEEQRDDITILGFKL